jgi:hypothetical protein
MGDRPPVALGGPAGARLPHAAGSGQRRRNRLDRRQILHQEASAFGGAPALGEPRDLENSHGVVQRHRHDVAQPNRAAGTIDALAADPYMAGNRKRRGGRARAHHPGMPQPLVYPLTIQGDVFQRIFRESGIRFSVRKCDNAKMLER